MAKPIKRHEALVPVSREHHHGLLLSWKIREGLKKNISTSRIKEYMDYFWENNLKAHFDFEEKYIFPILGQDHEFIKRALSEHTYIKELFFTTEDLESNFSILEKELISHIRFEERELFKEIELAATAEQLQIIEAEHSKLVEEEWEDEFWIHKPQ